MLRLIATDFIQVLFFYFRFSRARRFEIRIQNDIDAQALPVPSVRALVEADALYGRQQTDQNISLSALAQLVSILHCLPVFLSSRAWFFPYTFDLVYRENFVI